MGCHTYSKAPTPPAPDLFSQGENVGSDRRAIESVERGEVGFPFEFGAALQEPDAAIPAKDGVVVAGRMDLLGLGKTMQGALHKREQGVWSAAGAKLGFHTAFVEKASVVMTLIRIGKALEDFLDFGVAVGAFSGELVGDGEAEGTQSQHVLGIGGEDVAADGFGFLGLVEVAVELGFGDGFGDSRLGNGF